MPTRHEFNKRIETMREFYTLILEEHKPLEEIFRKYDTKIIPEQEWGYEESCLPLTKLTIKDWQAIEKLNEAVEGETSFQMTSHDWMEDKYGRKKEVIQKGTPISFNHTRKEWMVHGSPVEKGEIIYTHHEWLVPISRERLKRIYCYIIPLEESGFLKNIKRGLEDKEW